MTIGMNSDSANPACSPLVAASASSQFPSHVTGSRVDSGSSPASTKVPFTTSDSQSIIASIILLLASLDASLVEMYRTENFQPVSFSNNLKTA